MIIRRYQVFISSTQRDLSEARDKVTWEALKLGFIPVGMENFSATSDRGWETIQKTIDLSDYYVVIVAGMYGSIEKETNKSWTEREYDYALNKGMKVLAFVRKLSAIKGDDLDSDRAKVEAFRERLKDSHLIETWTNIDDLRANVSTALTKASRQDELDGAPPPGWYRGPAPDVVEFAKLSAETRELRERVAENSPAPSQHIQKLKALAVGTSISARWNTYSGGYGNGDFTFGGIDEVSNIIKLHPRGQANAITTLPLDKIDTLFLLNNGTWRLTLHAFQ